ncbi:MAG TPA: energy transducer TonB [Ferruginibacter sp.]|jgi:protein TonB|nr:energy transducer TonB [Bacteroidota bacterium]MBS1924634.1 energy transducer TonB [Bacteroidota bacterium]MCC6692864.1 energy transducer TonB [Chitinophagaceae bacterium]HMT95414.1 energy transducer TonB [Ferruginibacter sp.]
MDATTILNADLLDILFDGKNKAYGAYQIRKKYPEAMAKALFTIAGLILLFWAANLFIPKLKNKSNKEIFVKEVFIGDLKKEKLPEPNILKPLLKNTLPKKVNQIKFVKLIVVDDKEVKPVEKIEDLNENQAISSQTIKSENTIQVVQAPVVDKGTNVTGELNVNDDENKIFIIVEKEAGFIGGQAAWVRYLKSKLNADVPVENDAPPGVYRVIVRFIVSKNGAISNVQAETSHGYGMEEEAIRVIKNGPNWVPALQNGQNVNAYCSQPVTFQVTE